MADYLLCITAAGGIPLLTRTKPGCNPLPFPVVGSLNGLHMFGLNHDVSLMTTLTKDNKIAWKLYQDSIVLIAIAPTIDKTIKDSKSSKSSSMNKASNSSIAESTVSDRHLRQLLDNVFHSLVLLIGLNELSSTENIDGLKKDLRACYRLIDTFLSAGISDAENPDSFGSLTLGVDVMLAHEAKLLLEHLQAFVEAVESTYGCLVRDGRVICATEKWWTLSGQELALLGRLVHTLSASAASCDLPVYLPHSSPNIPHRLLVFTLTTSSSGAGGGVRVCVLCGPKPSLAYVQDSLVERFWAPGVRTLVHVSHARHPVPDPIAAQLPPHLVAFLLIDVVASRCVAMTTAHHRSDADSSPAPHARRQRQQQQGAAASVADPSWAYRKLEEFYKFVVGSSFPEPDSIEENATGGDSGGGGSAIDERQQVAIAHYRVTSECKMFALSRHCYQLFAVYAPATPTFALRGLTESSLDVLLRDGLF